MKTFHGLRVRQPATPQPSRRRTTSQRARLRAPRRMRLLFLLWESGSPTLEAVAKTTTSKKTDLDETDFLTSAAQLRTVDM
ncbi:hypothetical protein ABIB38_000989 [Massilia sp. UYP11]|uniref:hypothetical protein n=1 Tax=Massilia sp. UYP11 TaxID=1756385 RepID=UPI003D1C1C14